MTQAEGGQDWAKFKFVSEIATNPLTRSAKQGLSCVIAGKCDGNAAFAFV